MVHPRLRPHRMLDLELQRLVLRHGRPRLCRWHSRPHLIWHRRSRHLHFPRQTSRIWHPAACLQAAEHDFCHPGDRTALVRVVRLQRGLGLERQPESNPGLHRYEPCGFRRRIDLDALGTLYLIFVLSASLPSSLRITDLRRNGAPSASAQVLSRAS